MRREPLVPSYVIARAQSERIQMTNVVIVSAGRTAVGSFNGSFANTPAHDLGRSGDRGRRGARRYRQGRGRRNHPRPGADRRSGPEPGTAGAYQGGPAEGKLSAWSLNQVCGSGLRAVALGAQHVQLGDARIVVAGGQESMSLAPHVAHLRAGQKMGDLNFIDSMIKDGLWDAFNGYHMGQTAENVANQWQISRDMQDEFALASQNKAEAAQKAGKFQDEIVAFTVKSRKGDIVVDQDEYIRHGATMEAMQKLKPAFTKDGSVTAANASGLNDGAAAVVLMDADEAAKRGLTVLARIASYATAGLDPSIMGVGPDPCQPQGAAEGGLEGRRSGSGRGERGFCRSGLRGEQGHGLGSGDRERERRRDCHRPPDWRFGRADPEHAPVRNGPVGQEARPGDPLHRGRHGRRHVPL